MINQAAAPRCALYARISTADPAGALQFRKIRQFVRRRGWPVHAEYVDVRYPGAMHQLPALDELMQAAKDRRFDCVVVAELHRFGVDLDDFHERLQCLEAHGIRFVAAAESIDTGECIHASDGSLVRAGDVLLNVAKACSEFESMRELVEHL
jgi:DNA invertase Pin-like site-specific DNA recombinase